MSQRDRRSIYSHTYFCSKCISKKYSTCILLRKEGQVSVEQMASSFGHLEFLQRGAQLAALGCWKLRWSPRPEWGFGSSCSCRELPQSSVHSQYKAP